MSLTLTQPAAQFMVQETTQVADFLIISSPEAESMKTQGVSYNHKNQKLYPTSAFKLPWLTVVGAFQFIILTLTTMLVYSGGNLADLTCAGYTFCMNKFSDLGMTVSYSGRSNLASALIFNPSIFFFGLTLIPLGKAIHHHFESQTNISARLNKFTLRLAIVAAVGLAGVGLTPKNLTWAVIPHIFTQSIGFLALMGWEICCSILIFKTQYPNAFAWVNVGATVVQFGYFFFLFNENNVTGMLPYCLAQKVIVYVQTAATLTASLGFLKQVTLKEDKIPIASYTTTRPLANHIA